MKQKFLSYFIAIFVLILSAPLSAQDFWDLPSEQLTQPAMDNLVYAVRDGKKLEADFYELKSPKPAPAVILVHGGGFLRGTKDGDWFTRAANWLLSRGFAVLNIDYRVIPDGGTFPKNVTDVKCAIRWLRAHAGELNVDPDRFGIIGESAGGYLASFAAVTGDNRELDCEAFPDVSDKIQAAVVYYGLHDFSIHDQYFFMTMGKLLWNKVLSVKDPLVIKSAPITYVKNAPPMLMFHGEKDTLVPVAHSRNMALAFKAAGKKYQYIEYPGLDHGFVIMVDHIPEARKSFALALDFLSQELGLQSSEK